MKKSVFMCLVLALVFFGCTSKDHVLLKSNIDNDEPFGWTQPVPFDDIDLNGDNYLDESEWGGYYPGGGTTVFYNVDKDNDKRIKRQEYKDFLKNRK